MFLAALKVAAKFVKSRQKYDARICNAGRYKCQSVQRQICEEHVWRAASANFNAGVSTYRDLREIYQVRGDAGVAGRSM